MNIKKYRKKASITQQELADATGIDRATIVRYENGTRTPPLENLKILANYFHISIDELVGTAKPQIPNDDDIKFALFGVDPAHITDAQFEEVKRFARYIHEQKQEEQDGGKL